jgi:NADP-dependent 3-hydroxy acid dehydrogenase YdfG
MKILLVGATGHVGSAVHSALRDTHDVITASRNAGIRVDVTDPASVTEMYRAAGPVDAVVVTVGAAPFKPLADLTRDDFTAGFTGKVLAQINLVQEGVASIADGGSFTLTTGILAREPIRTGAASSMANGALEAFVHAASIELPRGVRINAVSPTVLTEATGYHSSFPGFVPADAAIVAQAYRKAIENPYTGRILTVG